MNGQPQSSPSVVVETKQETLVSKKDKLCDFYVSARGCVKGDECDFSHPVAPSGTVTNRICDFFLKSRGCNKVC